MCLGTAILAGVAAGEYTDVGEAVAHVVHEVATVASSQAIAASYADQLNRYRTLRAAIMANFDFVAS